MINMLTKDLILQYLYDHPKSSWTFGEIKSLMQLPKTSVRTGLLQLEKENYIMIDKKLMNNQRLENVVHLLTPKVGSSPLSLEKTHKNELYLKDGNLVPRSFTCFYNIPQDFLFDNPKMKNEILGHFGSEKQSLLESNIKGKSNNENDIQTEIK